MNLRNCIRMAIGVSVVVVLPVISEAVPINLWSKRFGDSRVQGARDVAFDGSGNAYITGHMDGNVDFGGGVLSSAGEGDVFLAKYTATGVHLWSKRFGSAAHQEGTRVTTDALGNVVIVGRFYNTIDFGGGVFVTAGDFDAFVASFSPAGAHIWSKQIGNGNIQDCRGVAIDGSDNVVIAGYSTGATDFGGGAIGGAGGADVFVAKYSSAGAHIWSKMMGSANEQQGMAAAVDASDNVIVAGQFNASLDLGGGAMVSAGAIDAFVGKFDSAGNHIWSKRFGDGSDQKGLYVRTDAAGNVVLGGYYTGTIDLGGGPIPSMGSTDFFAAQFSPAGTHNWSGGYGSPGTDEIAGMAVHGTGSVFLTGYAGPGANFGGGALPSGGGEDVVLARLSPTGVHVWSASYGGGSYQSGAGVAVNPAGSIVIGGQFFGSVNFGTGALNDAGSSDACIAYFEDSTPIPVAFQDFRAAVRGRGVEVSWSLWSDGGMESFTLYRREGNAAASMRVASGAVDAATGSYADTKVSPGTTYHYELVVRESSGDEFRSPVATVTTPGAVATLGRNHPNPFNPSTRIEYSLNERSTVVLEIFSASGTLVTRLDQGVREAGAHRLTWDGRDLSGAAVGSGVYFYRIAGMPWAGTHKMVLLK